MGAKRHLPHTPADVQCRGIGQQSLVEEMLAQVPEIHIHADSSRRLVLLFRFPPQVLWSFDTNSANLPGSGAADGRAGCGEFDDRSRVYGNTASSSNASVAPNEIISIFRSGIGPANAVTLMQDSDGQYPTQAGGFAITFDGTPAPLLYASSGQVNLVTPGSLAGESTTQICAFVNSAATNCISMPVAPAVPQIFTTGPASSETPVPNVRYAAALNEDGSVNSQ